MSQSNRTTLTLQSDNEILIKRVFNAPRRLVFKVLTDPELIPRWWGPSDTTTIVDTMDVRPGGSYRYIHRSDDGSEVIFYGDIREVVPYERVVQTTSIEGMPGPPVVDTMTLEEHDGRTTLTVLEECPSAEVRDAIIASGMEEGMKETYDRLEALLQEVIVNHR